jgi:hypothetical protein
MLPPCSKAPGFDQRRIEAAGPDRVAAVAAAHRPAVAVLVRVLVDRAVAVVVEVVGTQVDRAGQDLAGA